MSLLLTFMELDRLYESSDRETLINNIKSSGKHYKFDKYNDQQLFSIWKKIEHGQKADQAKKSADAQKPTIPERVYKYCANCGITLSDGGLCPVCDDGEEHYFNEWLDDNGTAVNMHSTTASQQSAVATSSSTTAASTGYIVTIVYDRSKGKLRAQADDGIHGVGYVAFPNSYRTSSGQKYEVEKLIWNGKNYRVSGSIKSI
jgi:hypothetical protein